MGVVKDPRTLKMRREILDVQEYNELLEMFGTQGEIARRFGVSQSVLSGWANRLRGKERAERMKRDAFKWH